MKEIVCEFELPEKPRGVRITKIRNKHKWKIQVYFYQPSTHLESLFQSIGVNPPVKNAEDLIGRRVSLKR